MKPSKEESRGFITSLFDQQGISANALFTSKQTDYDWIVDSGATDNMTGCKDIIQNFQPYPMDRGVKIADGTLASIAGVGLVHVTPTLTLFPVLCT